MCKTYLREVCWQVTFFFPTGEDDHFDIIKDLTPVAARWKAIGVALGLKYGVLDSINPGSPDECLLVVIANWLMRNYNVDRFGPPTWRKLVEVVKDPAAGNNKALADEIARKHLTRKEDRKTCFRNLALYLATYSDHPSPTMSYILLVYFGVGIALASYPGHFSSSHMTWV